MLIGVAISTLDGVHLADSSSSHPQGVYHGLHYITQIICIDTEDIYNILISYPSTTHSSIAY